MTQTYSEIGKAKCPACQRSVALVRSLALIMVSRHLYQEQVQLNEVGAPTEYAPGFCPGSFHVIKD